MSTPVTTRPLSYVPFVIADVALLLTAALIAWRAPDSLSGGALVGVVACVGLGAVLGVVPFVMNDAYARDEALAQRQRELTDLMTTAMANTTRWATQWTAAATGLTDATSLAARSLATAERLSTALEEKTGALAQRLEHIEAAAIERAEVTVKREEALGARAERFHAVVETMKETAAGIGRAEQVLREQHAVLDQKVAAAERRLDDTAAALAARLTEADAALGALQAQVRRMTEAAAEAATAVKQAAMITVQPVVAVSVSAPVETPAPVPVAPAAVESPRPRGETIMDPFFVPDDGYAALAAAMDTDRA